MARQQLSAVVAGRRSMRSGRGCGPVMRSSRRLEQLGLPTSTVRTYLLRCGGIRPDPRHRGAGSAELRGARGDLPRSGGRPVAACDRGGLGRAPSTISREVAGNGGRRRYRAAAADQQAWARATRPKACKLATNPVLAGIVAEKLQRRWSPQQIAGWLKLTYPDDPGDARVAREHLPHAVRAVTRRAAQGADRLPAHRSGDPTPARGPAARWPRRPTRDPEHQRTTRRGRGPCGARSLGRRPGLRQEHEPGRHPGRTIDPVPDARRAARRQPQGRRRR